MQYELEMQSDDSSNGEDDDSIDGVPSSSFDKDWDQMSLAAASSARAEYSDRITYLCKEIGAPDEFQEIVGHYLLGHAKEDDEGEGRTTKMIQIVNIMAQAFALCARRADLVVLAMDDVHNVDRMSWKVIRKIFETCPNVLIFCPFREFASHPFKIEKIFWSKFKKQYTFENRFHFSELGPLEQSDITETISKCYSCYPKEIDDAVSKNVFIQSGGMPHYTSEILAKLSRSKTCGRFQMGK